MLSTQGIVSHSAARVPGMQNMLGTEGTPETGEFDFFNYLLGLQAGSDGSTQSEDGISSAFSLKTDTSPKEDPLLQIFQKKEEPMWNQMFPMVGQNQVAQSLPTPKADGNEMVQFDSKQDRNTSVQNAEGDKRYSSKTENAFVSSVDFLGLQKLMEKSNGDATKVDVGAEDSLVKANQMNNMIQKYTSNEINDDSNASGQSTVQLARAQENQFVRGGENNMNQVAHESLKADGEGTESRIKTGREKQQEDSLFALNTAPPAIKAPSGQIAAEVKGKDTPTQSIPEVFKKVESMVHHGGGKMTVQLSPADLGRVEIEVTARGKNVEIKMKSENEFAKTALESHMSELKHSMQGADLMLHKVEVTTSKEWDKSQMGGNFSFQEQQQKSQSNEFSRESSKDSSSRNFGSNFNSRSSRTTVMPATAGVTRSSFGGSRVDIRI